MFFFFFFQAEDGIRDKLVTGVQTCALPILRDHARDEQPAVGRVLRPEPGEFRRVALLRHSGERPRPARDHAQKRYQRADSHGWEYIPSIRGAVYGGVRASTAWRGQ